MDERDVVDEVFERLLRTRGIFKNREVLRSDFIPEKLPHREKEIRKLAEILAPILKGIRGSNILIYGKPGTGKTACIKKVIKKLQAKCEELHLNNTLCYVNCRISGTAYRTLSSIATSVEVEVPFTGIATGEVYNRILRGLRKMDGMLVITLDEIDTLAKNANGDKVLYELTRINENIGVGKVTLVGISNDLTFKEYLDPRVLSSLSEEEVLFRPYNAEELTDILKERAKEAFYKNALEEGVIEYCAALAAREHGDARRALELLRVAGEIAERKGDNVVTLESVDMALKTIEEDRYFESIRTLPLHSRLLLLCIFQKTQNNKRTTTGEVYQLYTTLCGELGLDPLTHRRASTLINELEVSGIILCKIVSQGRYGRTRRISLNIPKKILIRALKADPHLEGMLPEN
ncbi:cell division control protein Cdc6 [archaeon]|nr:MAG: cell division control protein Cdc6 [archaeon]